MGYAKTVLKGLTWMAILRVCIRSIAVVKNVFLARLLSPEQFGIFGISLLILALTEVLTDTGVNVLLIQEKNDINQYINSAWSVSIIRGLLIGTVIFLSAPAVAHFFNTPSSVPIIRLISLAPLMRGFINPSEVKYQKNMNFKKEFFFKFPILAVDTAMSIIMAFVLHKAICIVIGLLSGIILELVLSFILTRPIPRFGININYIKKIISRGKWVTFGGIFNYLFHNLDNIVVGKILGATALGLYQMAYSIAMLTITEVSDVFSRVTFPLYAKISEDKQRLTKAFIKSFVIVLFLSIVFGILFYFFPKEIVDVLGRYKWLPIIPVLKILAIFTTIRTICAYSFSLFMAVGKQEYVSLTDRKSVV